MKHFLIFNDYEFFMTDGVNQVHNVECLLHGMQEKDLRTILRLAVKTRASMKIRRNPVLNKLLSKILLSISSKLST